MCLCFGEALRLCASVLALMALRRSAAQPCCSLVYGTLHTILPLVEVITPSCRKLCRFSWLQFPGHYRPIPSILSTCCQACSLCRPSGSHRKQDSAAWQKGGLDWSSGGVKRRQQTEERLDLLRPGVCPGGLEAHDLQRRRLPSAPQEQNRSVSC